MQQTECNALVLVLHTPGLLHDYVGLNAGKQHNDGSKDVIHTLGRSNHSLALAEILLVQGVQRCECPSQHHHLRVSIHATHQMIAATGYTSVQRVVPSHSCNTQQQEACVPCIAASTAGSARARSPSVSICCAVTIA